MKRIYLIVLVIISICAFGTDSFAKSYSGELRKATESGKVYDLETMDARIVWHATLFTPGFRRAFAKRHVKLNHMAALEAAKWVAEAEMEQAEVWEFFVSMYTKKDYKGLDMDEDSFWKIRLIADGESYAPLTIERLSKTPYYKQMYKYIDRWSHLYRVVFQKVSLGKKPELSIYSIMGKSNLKWHLKN